MKSCIFLLSAALLTSGCTLGPNYQRPTVAVPGLYRGTISDEAAQTQLAPLGDQKWWDIFQDEQLGMLVRTALTQNYDSRIAASRMLEARAQLGIIRADQFPALGAGAGISDVREAKSRFLPAFETSTGLANLSAAWELDFWGKYRRATEAGRANLLASEWARREVVSTLVANVGSAYFQLRALDLELEISKRTLNSRQESLRLTRILSDGARRHCWRCNDSLPKCRRGSRRLCWSVGPTFGRRKRSWLQQTLRSAWRVPPIFLRSR